MKNKVTKIFTLGISIIILVSCMMLLAACQTDDELKSRNEELQNTINTLLATESDLKSRNEELQNTINNLLATQSDLITRNEILQNTVDDLLVPENELGVRYTKLQKTLNTLLTIDWRWNRNEGHLLVSIKHDYMNKTYTKDDFKGIKTSKIMSFSDGSYLIYLEDPAIEDLISAIVKLYDLDFVDKIEISSIDTGD